MRPQGACARLSLGSTNIPFGFLCVVTASPIHSNVKSARFVYKKEMVKRLLIIHCAHFHSEESHPILSMCALVTDRWKPFECASHFEYVCRANTKCAGWLGHQQQIKVLGRHSSDQFMIAGRDEHLTHYIYLCTGFECLLSDALRHLHGFIDCDWQSEIVLN